jgi:hypothetical protein
VGILKVRVGLELSSMAMVFWRCNYQKRLEQNGRINLTFGDEF